MSDNQNALIAHKNLVDRLVVGSTLTQTIGTTLAGYPLSNVQTRQLSKIAKFTSVGGGGGPIDSQISMDFGANKTIRLVALLGLSDVAAVSNSDVVFEYSRNGIAWYQASTGLVSDAGVPELPLGAFIIPGKAGPDLQPPSTYPEVGVVARYVRITLKWAPVSDGAAGRVLGRLWISDALILPGGVDASWQQGVLEPGQLDASAGLQAYENRMDRPRTLSCSLPKLDTMQAYGFNEGDASAADVACVQSLQLHAGATGEVIVLPRTSSSLWMRRLGIYGHMQEPPAIRHQKGPYFSTDFRVVEER
jgi:hypothetical protein